MQKDKVNHTSDRVVLHDDENLDQTNECSVQTG